MIARILLSVVLSFAASAQVGMPAPQVPAAAPKPASRPPAATSVPAHKALKFPPLRPYEAPQPVRAQLSNGMKILLLEDRERPHVAIVATIRAGAVYDPPGRTGLASLTASLMRSGGTSRRAPDRLDADMEAIGATIEGSSAESVGAFTFTVLKENLAEGLSLFRDILTEPAFRQDRLDFAKTLYLQSIMRRNDDPRELLRREFVSAIFGRESAHTRRMEPATIGPIARADVLAFYRRYYFPENIQLSVAGDFDATQLQSALEILFGQWKPQQPTLPELPKPGPDQAPGAYLAVRPGLRETYFTIGQSGGVFNEPDGAALEIAAAILGVGPQARLVRRAREAQGVIREIRADWTAGFGRPGIFQITASCASPSAGDAIKMVVEEVQKLRAAEPTDDEFQAARDAVLMKFVGGLDNKTKALAAIANLDYFGYPPDAIQQFQKALAGVTRADVLRVAKARLDPQNFTVVAVSNLNAFTTPRGAATVLDLAIPPPAAATSTPTAEAAEMGKKLLQRAQQASGGADKLAALKDYSQLATYLVYDGTRETQTDRWLAPTILRQDLQSSRIGTVVRFTDGKDGWLSNGRNSTALTGLRLKQARSEILRIYIPMLLSDRIRGRVLTALDDQSVEITEGDVSMRILFDRQTGLPASMLHEVESENQPLIFIEEELSDFRDVNGIKLPFAITVKHNGAKFADGVLSDVKLNQGLKVEVLQRRP